MNEYLLYLGIALAALLVALVVPGLKVIAEAILKALLELIFAIFRHKGTFLIWFVKTLASDHMRVLRHATTSRDVIDLTQKVRRKAEGYED